MWARANLLISVRLSVCVCVCVCLSVCLLLCLHALFCGHAQLDQSVVSAIATTCRNLEMLDVAGCGDVDDNILQCLSETSPKLHFLSIKRCSKVSGYNSIARSLEVRLNLSVSIPGMPTARNYNTSLCNVPNKLSSEKTLLRI